MTKLEISVMPPLISSPSIGSTNAENIAHFAKLADEQRFDAILLQDHLGISGAETYDNVVMLGAVAAITKRIRVGTLATPLPLRHPALVAKAIASLDQISNGRALLTVGAGWVREDFEWYGMKYRGFETRMEMMHEGVRVIKKLWEKSPADFSGKYYRLSGARLEPKPIQKPRPPIWVAGVSEFALKTAVEEGDGWFGWKGLSPSEFAAKVEFVDRLCEQAGRPRRKVRNGMHLQVSIASDAESLKKQAGKWIEGHERKDHHDMIACGTPKYFIDILEDYARAGADHVNVVFVPVDKASEQLAVFAEEVLSHFK